jgi:hypothetical protein
MEGFLWVNFVFCWLMQQIGTDIPANYTATPLLRANSAIIYQFTDTAPASLNLVGVSVRVMFTAETTGCSIGLTGPGGVNLGSVSSGVIGRLAIWYSFLV